MKLSDRVTKKIIKYVREHPTTIMDAIQETVEYAEQYKKENDEMFYKLFDINRLSNLLLKYRKWLNYNCNIDNGEIATLLLSSKFPTDRNIKGEQRYVNIHKFIMSL